MDINQKNASKLLNDANTRTKAFLLKSSSDVTPFL